VRGFGCECDQCGDRGKHEDDQSDHGGSSSIQIESVAPQPRSVECAYKVPRTVIAITT
jgi:hypothetical protein